MTGLAGGEETSIYFSRVSLFAAAVLSLGFLVILSPGSKEAQPTYAM